MKQPNSIRRVLIVGGTHGNEFIGVYLIKKLEQQPALIQRTSLEAVTLFANPKAFAVSRRYLDKDLNRCFRRQDLQDATLSSYEDRRAQEIDRTFGSNGTTPVDLVIDLHSTTSNMGVTLLVKSHPFNLQLAAHLSSIDPLIKVCDLSQTQPGRERSSLPSICELGCTIEVGPLAQGTLHAELFQKTEALVYAILDYVEHYNQGTAPPFENELTLYRQVSAIDFPRNESGEIQAMIHPQRQFQDYQPLNSGDPIFLTFGGDAIAHTGSSTVYPIFINEAAYYEKGIAMCLTEKQSVKL